VISRSVLRDEPAVAPGSWWHMPRRGRWLLLIVCLGSVLVGCGSDKPTSVFQNPIEGIPEKIVVVAGDSQTGLAQTLLPDTIVVRVLDHAGRPYPGANITFTPTYDSLGETGAVLVIHATTGQDGTARTEWVLSHDRGPNYLVASCDCPYQTLGVIVYANGIFGPPAALARIVSIPFDPDLGLYVFAARAGEARTDSLGVTVCDSVGNALWTPATVTWTVSAHGGTVSPAVTPTDSTGAAWAHVTLGYLVDSVLVVSAAAPGLRPALFPVVAKMPLQYSAKVVGGAGQTGTVYDTLPVPLAAQLTSLGGIPLFRAPAIWAVRAGGGTLIPLGNGTDSSGMASARWVLGPAPGVQQVVFNVSQPDSVVFTANAMALPGGTLTGTVAVTNFLLTPPSPSLSASARPQIPGFGASRAVPRMAMRPRTPRALPDRILVTFKPGSLGVPGAGSLALAAPSMAARAMDAMRASLAPVLADHRVQLTDLSPVVLTARLKVSRAASVDSVVAELRQDPSVETEEPDVMLYPDGAPVAAPQGVTTPNDPFYPSQAWNYAMVGLPHAWNTTTGSSSVLVAVVDNGVVFDHPDLAGRLTSDGFDFVSMFPDTLCDGRIVDNAGDGDGYDSNPATPIDYDLGPGGCLGNPSAQGGHGTHVAGIIGAAGNDGQGLTGVNWDVRIRPVRVLGLDGGSSFDVAQGILYAAGLPASDGGGRTIQAPSAARIINLSLGGPAPSTVLLQAVQAAVGAGALVVASAGNSASPDADYPAAYGVTLAVSSVGPTGGLSSFSSYGSAIDLAAPGGEYPFGIWSTTCDFRTTPCTPNYAQYLGTSMAAPHVSGVAALILASNPSLDRNSLQNLLLRYATDIGDSGRDDFYGWGMVNARNSLAQGVQPSVQLYVRVYNATTGAIVQTQPAGAGGTFAFSGLPDGNYWLYAGEDEGGDGLIGVPGRRWGAFGYSGLPTPIPVTTLAGNRASFIIGYPTETVPGSPDPLTSLLPVGGYQQGYAGGTVVKTKKVLIPSPGTYTFETSGTGGAGCGTALEANTALTLTDTLGTTFGSNDDIDPEPPPVPGLYGNRCSRLTLQLSPGAYLLKAGEGTPVVAGRYLVQVRSGP